MANPLLPRFDLTRTLVRRDQILDRALFGLLGTVPEGEGFKTLVTKIHKALPKAEKDVLYESLRYLLGQVLTREAAKAMAWRLAANYERLQHGIPVHVWSTLDQPMWLPLMVSKVDYPWLHQIDGPRPRWGQRLHTLITGGSPAGLPLLFFWSTKMGKFASQPLGFSSIDGPHPFLTGLQLCQMCFCVLAFHERQPTSFPALLDGQQVWLSEVQVPGSCRTINQNLLKMRARQGGFTCPHQYTHPCHQCAVGLKSCPAATHPDDYVPIESCPRCEQTSFGPPDGQYCAHCQPLIDCGVPLKRKK
jgi:hypothetical protein